MNTKICYIFAAGERTPCHIQLAADDLVIAADGGFDYLQELGLRADYVIGDFDSLTSSFVPADCLRYPQKKDDTDLMLAVKLGLEKDYREFIIYGGLGGRLDHTLGNIQILTYLSRCNAHGTLYGDSYTMQVITDGSLSFTKETEENKDGNICSIFSLSDVSVNVTIQGFEYEVEGITLTNSFPLGISNTFLGKKSFISVQKGTLCVLAYNTTSS